MPLWRKQPWPDDPPKGNGTTIKGIETFGDLKNKDYMDSLNLYNYGKKFAGNFTNEEAWNKYANNMVVLARSGGVEEALPFDYQEKYAPGNIPLANFGQFENDFNSTRSLTTQLPNPQSIKPIKYRIIEGDDEGFYSLPIYQKPTGNGLFKPIVKVPTINPNIPTELPKLPMRSQPQGNVELQNTGYTNIGMRKKPDGTRFIYDKSGKTDKTVTIDDNRIGFEYYIKKLYE